MIAGGDKEVFHGLRPGLIGEVGEEREAVQNLTGYADPPVPFPASSAYPMPPRSQPTES